MKLPKGEALVQPIKSSFHAASSLGKTFRRILGVPLFEHHHQVLLAAICGITSITTISFILSISHLLSVRQPQETIQRQTLLE
jgi:hypothetical protein